MNKKKIKDLVFVFVVGGLGGIVFGVFIFPKLLSFDFFSNIKELKSLKDQTVIINKTEKVYIAEEEVLGSNINKVKESLVYIQTFKNNRFISSGFGFIVSSDGYIITRKEVVFSNREKIKLKYKGENYIAKIAKEDKTNGLVLLSSNISNAPVVAFPKKNISVGLRVFLVGEERKTSSSIDFVNVGIIKSIDNYLVKTNIKENDFIVGTPLINLKGEVIGINFVNSNNDVLAISSKSIKDLIFN